MNRSVCQGRPDLISFRRSSAGSSQSPALSISHAPVAIRRSWTISSFESLAAARSPLTAIAS